LQAAIAGDALDHLGIVQVAYGCAGWAKLRLRDQGFHSRDFCAIAEHAGDCLDILRRARVDDGKAPRRLRWPLFLALFRHVQQELAGFLQRIRAGGAIGQPDDHCCLRLYLADAL
jgi:hypothetical protein